VLLTPKEKKRLKLERRAKAMAKAGRYLPNRKNSKAAARADLFRKKLGLKTASIVTPGGAITGAVAGMAQDAASSYFQSEAIKEQARQEAIWRQEVARQATHQAAIAQNATIMHELDYPFLMLEGDLGTKRKPMPFRVNLSLLGSYGLGNLAVAVQQDMAAIEAGADPVHVSTFWQDARTPRTEKFRNTQPAIIPGQTGGGGAEATATHLHSHDWWLAEIQKTKKNDRDTEQTRIMRDAAAADGYEDLRHPGQ